MRDALVYDLPTRIFHWIFAALFIAAFVIGKNVDDESPTFIWHMAAGTTMVALIALRLVWGLIGTRHARFASFALRPAELIEYMRGVCSGSSRRWVGHNPASSWAAILMLALGIGLGASGYLMASGSGSEAAEEIHEIFANVFLIVVALHIIGTAFHMLRHRDGLALSMVDGRKSGVHPQESIAAPARGSAVIMLVIVAGVAAYLLAGMDTKARTLTVFGTPLQVPEEEEHEHGEHH